MRVCVRVCVRVCMHVSVPGLYEAALPCDGGLCGQVYGGEEHVWDLGSAAAAAVGQLRRKRHVELIVGDMTESTARGRQILTPATHRQTSQTKRSDGHTHTPTHAPASFH